jgi:hypothetical protein
MLAFFAADPRLQACACCVTSRITRMRGGRGGEQRLKVGVQRVQEVRGPVSEGAETVEQLCMVDNWMCCGVITCGIWKAGEGEVKFLVNCAAHYHGVHARAAMCQ